MKIELPPQYDSKAVEKPVYEKWIASGAFHAVPDGRAGRFSMVIPPPNVTGALHLGHGINGTIQDILTRYHRMKGDNTLWMPGIDHAGIATQAVVEKTIFEKEKKSRHDLGREELVRRIWEWKESFGTRILNQQAQLGASCDWARTRFTLDEVCAKAVREAFFKMFKDGLIFRGKRLVNWDAQLQTAVADDEIYHETVKGQLTSIRYPVAVEGNAEGRSENSEFLIVATTRPETMLGDTAVAVHPEDPRYKHLHGKFVVLPLVGRRIPVICDGLLVDPTFGTGVVKVTPAHDPNDYATGQRHGLEMINLLTPDGKVNENGEGEFLGKKYSYVGLKFATAARKAVLSDLEALGLIAETKVHEHEVGHSDRSKTPIEPYLSDQWFVRMGDVGAGEENIHHRGTETQRSAQRGEDGSGEKGGIALADGTRKSGLAQAAMDAVIEGRVKITPERYARGYLDWLGQKRDWCISRQLWWGHRIPVWSKRYEGPATGPSKPDSFVMNVLFPGKVVEEGSGSDISVQKFGDSTGETMILGVCVRPGRHDLEHTLEKEGFVQDPDVLDTWFSSALWPISTMGWPSPVQNLPEGSRIPVWRAPKDGLEAGYNRTFGSKPDGVTFSDFIDSIRRLIAIDRITATTGYTFIHVRDKGDAEVVKIIEDWGYSRDPDGLDTWFSNLEFNTQNSDLKTKNWPEAGLLDYFYPTSVLSTARDILTLWVARMVMFGLYCRGDVPFRQVFVHAVIQDGEGRTMSKSKGNGVDPVDIIGSHGADALRFTLAQMSTDTQDIRMPVVKDAKTGVNTSPKFDIGRNFANKIWNASRFILSNIQEGAVPPGKPGAKYLEDRWILSRLTATIKTVEESINGFHFSEVANSLYQFFWSDLCDWYLEIAKARIKGGDLAVQAVLLECLETVLKLLHPMMPFITEEIWGKLREGDTLKRELRTMLVMTAWPVADGGLLDAAAETQIAVVQEVTSAIREIQNRYPGAKGKAVVIRPKTAELAGIIETSRGIIEALAGAAIAENSLAAEKPADAATSVLAEAEIYIGGAVDKGAEVVKLTKRKGELEKFIAGGRAKLSNEAAVAKVPAKISEGWRSQLAQQEAELAAVEKNLKELGG
jgi:valyl-tRNA synthetase